VAETDPFGRDGLPSEEIRQRKHDDQARSGTLEP
jgi:hypothetical protein